MAGDWIKFEHATLDKPEVVQMADLLETTADDVVGKLLRVWCWFDLRSRDGNAGGVTGDALKRFIDRHVASQGFASCMQKVGWLDDVGITNFDRHNGKSAKNRALTKDRVKRSRNDDVTQKTSPEKRREEKKENKKRKGVSPLPADFRLSERVLRWGEERGYPPEVLQRHCESFMLTAHAKGYEYSDWDSALMKAITADWAKLGKGNVRRLAV